MTVEKISAINLRNTGGRRLSLLAPVSITSGLPVIQAQSFEVYPADHIRAG